MRSYCITSVAIAFTRPSAPHGPCHGVWRDRSTVRLTDTAKVAEQSIDSRATATIIWGLVPDRIADKPTLPTPPCLDIGHTADAESGAPLTDPSLPVVWVTADITSRSDACGPLAFCVARPTPSRLRQRSGGDERRQHKAEREQGKHGRPIVPSHWRVVMSSA